MSRINLYIILTKIQLFGSGTDVFIPFDDLIFLGSNLAPLSPAPYFKALLEFNAGTL